MRKEFSRHIMLNVLLLSDPYFKFYSSMEKPRREQFRHSRCWSEILLLRQCESSRTSPIVPELPAPDLLTKELPAQLGFSEPGAAAGRPAGPEPRRHRGPTVCPDHHLSTVPVRSQPLPRPSQAGCRCATVSPIAPGRSSSIANLAPNSETARREPGGLSPSDRTRYRTRHSARTSRASGHGTTVPGSAWQHHRRTRYSPGSGHDHQAGAARGRAPGAIRLGAGRPGRTEYPVTPR
eukprot:511440-Hanusia_phi.AAC.3